MVASCMVLFPITRKSNKAQLSLFLLTVQTTTVLGEIDFIFKMTYRRELKSIGQTILYIIQKRIQQSTGTTSKGCLKDKSYIYKRNHE